MLVIAALALAVGPFGFVTAGSASAATPVGGQTVTYTKTITLPVPPASNFAGSGGGDGWALGFTSTEVYNVFHHQSTLQVACHHQADASSCTNSPETITDSSGNGYAISSQPGLWLNQATGYLYVWGDRTSDYTPGVVCIDTTQYTTNTDPFCGFTPTAKAGEAPLTSESVSPISDPVTIGTKWYAFLNYVTTATPTGDQDTLMCFDESTLAACGSQPYAVNLGSGAYSLKDGGFPNPSIAAIGDQIVIPETIGGTDMLACYDTTLAGNCAGSWPVAAPTGYIGEAGAPYPLLSSSGSIQGVCVPTGTDQCFTTSGASTATPSGMSAAITQSSPWDGPSIVLGPRVYTANGYDDGATVDCYDASTNASCTNFPKALSNIELLYTVNPDPARPTCIWVNADGGTAQIQNFDAYTGGACGQGVIRVLASQFVVPTDACVPASFTSLQILQPPRASYTSGTVAFEDGDGNAIAGIPNQNVDGTGTVGLSSFNLNTNQGLPQFLITLNGASSNPGSVQVKLTWTGTYSASCVGTGTTVGGATASVGYRLQGGDGGVFDFGSSTFQGSLAGKALSAPVSGAMATTTDNAGYWMVGQDGAVYALGDATYHGRLAGPAHPIVGVAGTSDNAGYWLVDNAGDVYSYGDASFYGSLGGIRLAKPIVGMAPTPDHHGYWLVASDGGVFAFGDAGFYGSAGAIHLASPVVGIVPSHDGAGYWLVASDGGVFSYGDATFHGSAGGIHLAAPVIGGVASPDGGGYWMMASDGGVFAYGDAPFLGSMGGMRLAAPITAATT